MKKINPGDLIPLDIFEASEPIKIDLVYAKADHPRNIFGEALYHNQARLWAHKDMAAITLLVSRLLHKNHDWTLEIYDCLRPVDTQQAMQETKIVKENPDWMEGEFPLLSKPGMRGHPRAMAIDVGPITNDGSKIDMGTPFDDMSEKSARDFTGFKNEILEDRKNLETAFINSAKALNLPILPLPNEWWDFRFPNNYTEKFSPLSDADLPPQMQMTKRLGNDISDFDNSHFEKLADSILALIEPFDGNL